MTDEMPPGWAVARLESLIGRSGVMTDGDWVESKDQDPDGEVRLIQLADIGDGSFLDKSNRFMTKAKAEELNCTFLQPRDVLVSRLGEPLGKTCLFPSTEQPCVTVVDVHVVRPASTAISREWLVHLMNSPPIRRIVDRQSSGTTRKRITGQKLKDLEVRVAPAEEQIRIASKIDELFSRIDEGERALERVSMLVERYRQSVLKAAVTGELTREWREKNKDTLESGEALHARILTARREAWEKAELEKMKAKGITPANDKWKQKYQEPSPPDTTDLPQLPDGWLWASVDQVGLVTGGLTKNQKRGERDLRRPFLRVANVYANRLELDDMHEIGVSESELDRVLLKQGDVLVVEGNGSIEQIGRVALWDGSIEGCVHQNHLIKVRCTEPLPSWYVLIWCMSPLGRAQIRRAASSTAGLHTLSISKIQALPIPIPTGGELGSIADRFGQMDSLVVSQREAVRCGAIRSSSLRQAILQAAFRGELVERDRSDEPASTLLERIAAERGAEAAAQKRGRKKKTPA